MSSGGGGGKKGKKGKKKQGKGGQSEHNLRDRIKKIQRRLDDGDYEDDEREKLVAALDRAKDQLEKLKGGGGGKDSKQQGGMSDFFYYAQDLTDPSIANLFLRTVVALPKDKVALLPARMLSIYPAFTARGMVIEYMTRVGATFNADEMRQKTAGKRRHELYKGFIPVMMGFPHNVLIAFSGALFQHFGGLARRMLLLWLFPQVIYKDSLIKEAEKALDIDLNRAGTRPQDHQKVLDDIGAIVDRLQGKQGEVRTMEAYDFQSVVPEAFLRFHEKIAQGSMDAYIGVWFEEFRRRDKKEWGYFKSLWTDAIYANVADPKVILEQGKR